MKFSLRTLIWAFVLIAMILAMVFTLIPKPVDVEIARVSETPLRVTVQEDGKTRIREKYVVSAPVSGRLSRIGLKSGDELYGDQSVIAVILPSDPAMLDARAQAEAEARVAAAEAAVKRSESSLEQAIINHQLAKAKLERIDELLGSRSVSRDEYDIAFAGFQASQKAIDSARFGKEIASFELEMAKAAATRFEPDPENREVIPFEIRAPVSGKVLRIFQESSTVVTVGTPLIELGDPQNLEMEIDVLSTDAVRIKPGAELTVEHWGGESPLKGNVRVVEPAAFTKISSLGIEEQRVNVIADFNETPDRIARLGDGYRVEAQITVSELPSTLTVPNSALFRHQRQWHVLVADEGVARMVPVQIGLQNQTLTQVVQGLSQGEDVIIYPSDEISSGTRINPVNSATSQ